MHKENILLLLASYCFYIIFLGIVAYVIAQSSGVAIDPARFATQCSFILILAFVLYLFINSYKDWLDMHHPNLEKEYIDQDIHVTEIPTKDSNKGHIFVCYNHADADEVHELANRIEKSTGARIWLDIHEIQPGEPWQDTLRRGIEKSESCIVCLGPSGISNWQKNEIEIADQIKKKNFKIIPVFLPGYKDYDDIPMSIRRLQYVDLRDLKNSEKQFTKLVRAIRILYPHSDL